MTKEKLFLLDVLKSFIHEEKLNFDIELDWPKLMQLSTIHTVTGILGYMAMQNPGNISEAVLKTLKNQCLASVAVFTQRTKKADELIAKLNEADIDHVLFKGYVVRNYYPVPELRTYGDIDILIKPTDREKCHALMLSQDFEVKTDWEPVFSYYKASELYEMHTEIMEIDVSDKADYKGFFGTAWENTKKVGEHSYELTDEFHFLYLLTHIAKHIHGSGAGVRMYLDIAAFVKHFGDSIDWNYINGKLEELCLKDFANVAMTVAEKYLGVPSPLKLREIEADTLESFIDFTMDGGVFGHFGRDSGLVSLKNSNEKTRTATVMRRLFPTAESIESRYTYLQGKHWLLPVAWAHRVFKTRETWAQHAAEAKSIMQTDSEEVMKLKRIYKEIGL